MTDFQANTFLDGEGDAWFLRNQERLFAFDPADDLACTVLAEYDYHPKRVLEIGAANGFRLAALAELYGCEVMGTDASPAAVEDGMARYGIPLSCQAAESVEVQGEFDLVVIHFLLHWLDRSTLPTLVDRVAATVEIGGLLLLGDFSPDRDVDVPYHHLPGQNVMTYKRDYGSLFTDSGHFRVVGFTTADHRDMRPASNVISEHRVAIWLLERVEAP